jgi:two-component SAPR family response regulator
MKYVLTQSIIVAALLLPVSSVNAQSIRFMQRGYPDVTDAYQSGRNLYNRTWADLNQAQQRVAPYPGDWYRFDVARGQMDLLERTWQDGSFNRAQLNDAISDVQQVLQFNNVSSQDHEKLARDLEHLRDIRVRFGQ